MKMKTWNIKMWDAIKAVLRGEFFNTYIKKSKIIKRRAN